MTTAQLIVMAWVMVAGMLVPSAAGNDMDRLFEDYPDISYRIKFWTAFVAVYGVVLCWPALLLVIIMRIIKRNH